MPHDNGHGHHHHLPNARAGDRRVGLAIAVYPALSVAQIGGLIFGSVALIADAVHNLSDAETLGITAWILWHALREIGPVVRILMLAAPDDVSPGAVRHAIEAEPGVEGVHHLHLWLMDEHRTSVEANLVQVEGADFAEVMRRVKAHISGDFGITHVTFEPETRAWGVPERGVSPDVGSGWSSRSGSRKTPLLLPTLHPAKTVGRLA